MTGVKDIKEPKVPKKESKAGKGGTRKPTEKDPTSDSPWIVNPTNGEKIRNTRALPLENRLKELFAGLSGVATLAGDQFVGSAIEAKGPELAYGYAKLAQENPQVKTALTWLLEGSAYTEAIIPTVGLVIMVGWHYGFIPDRLGVGMSVASGVVPVSREVEAAQKAQAAGTPPQAENDGKSSD